MEQEKNKLVNNECLCFALKRCSRAITQLYDHAFSETKIRSTQFNLLMSMAQKQAKTLTELAVSLVMDRTTLTRNLKPLERAGLIVSAPTRDKRSKAYTLTEEGTRVVEQALPLWQATQDKIDAAVGPRGRMNSIDQLNLLIQKIHDIH